MALGYSETVYSFIKEASRSKKIAVLVTENAPQKDGIKMVEALTAANIQVTLISDAAVFVFMPKISKVVIGARTGNAVDIFTIVYPDGRISAVQGSRGVVTVAERYSVPIIFLAGLHKLSPHYHVDPEPTDPSFVLPYDSKIF